MTGLFIPALAHVIVYFSFLITGFCSHPGIAEPEITVPELQAHIEYLSSDLLEGRYPGTTGDRLAAEYIRNQFNGSGLKLKADNGFQHFSLASGIIAGENNSMIIEDYHARPDSDFTPFPFTANSSVTAEVVFCGYGFSINEHGLEWDDYYHVDVTDKWVMVLRGDPEPDDPVSIFAPHGNDRWKAYLAEERGAAGMIMVSGRRFHEDDLLVEIAVHHGRVGIPVIHVKRHTADSILSASGKSLESLEKSLIANSAPLSFPTGVIVNGTTEVIAAETETMNIVAWIEGSDPLLKNEFILIGAHYDHLGTGGEGSSSRRRDIRMIHPGADDNASGVSAMLEIAEKISAERNRFRRSLIFVAFGAEEKGLIGSKYFVENPVVDLESIITMINLDMIGRKNEERFIQIGGIGTSAEGEQVINSVLENHDLNPAFSMEGFGPSDHASFYARDIPVFFLTTGPHTDYHTPDDSACKINFNGIKTISDFVFDLAAGLDEMDYRLTFLESGPKTPATTRHGNRRISLGIMPDFTFTGEEGLRAEFVTPGRPAELGGMKKGDIIVSINGNPVKDIHEYMYRLEQLKQGEIINVEIVRDDKKEIIVIQL